MRTTLACWFAIAVGAAACGGGDDGYNPPGDDDGDDDPDAMRPDADPSAIDAATTPDAIGDGSAPQITPMFPLPGQLVSGRITIAATVVDADGVDDVNATMGPFELDMIAGAGNLWSVSFDTAPLAPSAAPTISIRAIDTTGATSHYDYVVVLDNASPRVSMDPPNVRTVNISQGIQCSVDFDPLGTDAPDDGQSVLGGSELRARVEDRSNAGNVASNIFIPRAGVASADVYVLDDTTRPVVVDTDADGICDDINPDLVPATIPDAPNEALVVALAAVEGSGTAHFTADAFGGSNGTCTAGDDTDAPEPLCPGELGITVAIDEPFTQAPEIYGIPEINDNNCLGYFVDASVRGIGDGWACAAVRATDAVGNHNVSAPLRLCIDNDESGDCLPIGEVAAEGLRPDCTGTVTGGVVTSTPCVPEGFFEGDDADEFELIFP